MSTETITLLLAALVLGGVIGWLLCRAREGQTHAEQREAVARLRVELEAERKRHQDSQAVLAEAERRFREAFSALSADALKSNNEAFLSLATTSLGQFQQGAAQDLQNRQKAIADLLMPIKESLTNVQSHINELEKKRLEAYAGLEKHLETMSVTEKELHSETANLVKALRSPTVRGRWGEIQLKRVVEMAGMIEHCDFREQESVRTDDGVLRPDVVVRLPGDKNVVVDAKAPLQAYLEALEAPDDATRDDQLTKHARQVRDHITQLSSKAYWSQFEPAPEFVVMFLPGETFFSAALEKDPGLIEYGVEQRVIPSSPTTLIALLRAVAYGWRQERLAENAQAISELGRELYDRVCTWAEHLGRMGKGLEHAVDAYNHAVGSLEGRVLVSARRFPELGVAVSKDAPVLEPIGHSVREASAPECGDAASVPESLKTTEGNG